MFTNHVVLRGVPIWAIRILASPHNISVNLIPEPASVSTGLWRNEESNLMPLACFENLNTDRANDLQKAAEYMILNQLTIEYPKGRIK